tara:strand:- start:8707 stop:9435 length:729 start_codon:yes stop_codon:yes gene_type:complete
MKKYKLLNLKKVKSTNFELKKILKKKKNIENLCVSADIQTSGYGRRKTKWYSYKGNIHISIFLLPNCSLNKVNQLSFLTSISIGQTLKKIKKNINFKYKWPNDIIIEKKKVGGVLIETSSSQNRIKWAIVGIGINIKKYPKLNQNFYKATSFFNENIKINKRIFINLFLKNFFNNYNKWQINGFNFIKKKWLSNIYKNKNLIKVKEKNRIITGKSPSLSTNGSLKLNINKKIKEFSFGDQII